jgi:hypothetical protein
MVTYYLNAPEHPHSPGPPTPVAGPALGKGKTVANIARLGGVTGKPTRTEVKAVPWTGTSGPAGPGPVGSPSADAEAPTGQRGCWHAKTGVSPQGDPAP